MSTTRVMNTQVGGDPAGGNRQDGDRAIPTFSVTLRDGSVEDVFDADAYEPDRQLTTFYRTGNARTALDCWSVRLASFRTDEISMIRRVADAVPAERSLGSLVQLAM